MNPMITLNCGNGQEGGAIPPSISNVVQFPNGGISSSTSTSTQQGIFKFVQSNPLFIILLIIVILLWRKKQ